MTTLQDCLKAAQLEPKHTQDRYIQQVNFKATEEIYDICTQIARNHGVTLSAYLRKCCENLVREYRDAQPK